MSLRAEDQRGKASYAWDRPKIIVHAVRLSRGRWRMAAWPDTQGLAVYQSHIGIWPRKPEWLPVIAALLNGPLANAYVADHEYGSHITKATLEDVPLPALEVPFVGEVRLRLTALQEAIGTAQRERASQELLHLDAAVTAPYQLPEDLERRLLRYFRGNRRPVRNKLRNATTALRIVILGLPFMS